MTQMLALAISCYFHHTDVMRICANVYAGNIASMRVLEKIGFRKCGIHRNACFKNGVFTDCHYFELLKRNLGIWLNSTKTPGFTLLGIKLGVYLPITNFQRLLRKDRLSDL